jgi:hypothetical protein
MDEPDPEPMTLDTTEPSADAEPPEEAATELTREMDLLRDQLEAAFAEVVGQVDQLGRRVAALRQTTGAQSEAMAALSERGDSTLALVQDLVATLDAAVAAGREPREPEPLPVDLEPVVERLSHLDQAIAATHRELVRIQDVPLPVDTSRLEDVASRGSLHNAADIANLRRDVELLTESARSQDKTLRELRSTLEWIKDRMLR